MTGPKVTLHDVSVEGDGDREQLLGAIETAVRTAASGHSAPTPAALRTGIRKAVAGQEGGGQ